MIGELLPDVPALDNPGVLQARNVTPYAQGYRPVRNLVANTNALTARCQGAALLQDGAGVLYNYAGDATSVYTRAADTYSALTGTYTVDPKHRWEFDRWYDTVVATNGANALMTGDFNAELVAVADAPVARHVAVARNFIVAGNNSTDAAEVSWSALGQPTNWTTGESGAQHLDGAGSITRVLGGEYLTIMMEGGIYRGTYIAGPATWQFDHVVRNKSVPYEGAVVQVGHQVFFLSHDGFYRFDGASISPLSSGKMTRAFYDDFDREAAHLMTAEADLENNLVYFAYPGTGHGDECNRMYVYNYVTGLWTGPIEQKVQELLYSQSPGVQSDTSPDPGDEDVDTGAYAAVLSDSPQFRGGNDPVFGGFIETNQHAVPIGTIKQALIETGEYQHNPGGYAYVSGLRPYVDGTAPSVTAAIKYRNSTSGAVTDLGQQPINPRTGKVDQRISARYHRYEVQVSGDYDSIHGGDPEWNPAGAQ